MSKFFDSINERDAVAEKMKSFMHLDREIMDAPALKPETTTPPTSNDDFNKAVRDIERSNTGHARGRENRR